MNVSLASHATGAAHAASGKPGKGGDPLADFMALLGQLGITVEPDGTLAAATTTPTGSEDIAAKILAKLGKKGSDKPSADMLKLPAEAAGEEGDDGSAPADSDPESKLAALLASLDQPVAEPGRIPEKLDIAGLLSAIRAMAAGEVKSATDNGKPSEEANSVAPAISRPAASIASLLARTTRDSKGAPTPGAVQSAFVQLEKLVAGPQSEPETDTTATAANEDTVGPKQEQPDAAKAKLGELLARLTVPSKPGAAQAQPQLPQTAASHAARPVTDPQMAAIAQAIQQAAGGDRSKDDAGDQTSPNQGAIGTTFAIGSTPVAATPSGDVRTDALPDTMNHHLDLARDSEWLDTLARDITRAAHSDTHLRFNLSPEHLGNLKVELLNGANGTSVKLTTETEVARAILVDAQPRLVAEARAQGLRISETHVDLNGQGQGQRNMAETPVVIRTSNAAAIAEVERDMPAGSGERYA
jgi:flagellar hook-length control protein FliK